MSPSIQTLIDEFKNVVFDKVELECQDNSTLVEVLPLLLNQDSKSVVKINFHNCSCLEMNSLLQVKSN